ncbi:MAG: Gfo/Idh/MocA family oxidoreductase [Bacteroidota bacterium]
MSSKKTRRDFLKTSLYGTGAAIVGVGIIGQGCAPSRPTASKYMGDFIAPKLDKIRCGFIGVGSRGSGHMSWTTGYKDAEVVAIADPHIPTVEKQLEELKERGITSVKTYTNGDNDYLQMLKKEKLDVVIIATPWEWHAKQAIAAMEAGVHAFVEVPLGITMEEMWQIVDTSERTQKHCMMMENVNYGREELMYLNMCHQNVIGELLHGEAAYIHELRGQMNQEEHGTGSWRTYHYSKRNGNLYPTHGLGPVAQYMNLARTDDMFNSIVSYSSPAIGRELFAKKNFSAEHKWNKIGYKCGDINTSIIKTNLGRTIMVQWDETSPRPYSRLNLIQGTKGTLSGFPTRIAIEGDDHHHWTEGEELEKYYEKYEHPLWLRMGEEAKKDGGHGGMDYIMRARIFECLRNEEPLDQNVYEGAFWSAVGILSEKSVKEGGMPQEFPDFTRGNWKNTKPLGIVI